jgi:hypothetical protein
MYKTFLYWQEKISLKFPFSNFFYDKYSSVRKTAAETAVWVEMVVMVVLAAAVLVVVVVVVVVVAAAAAGNYCTSRGTMLKKIY